MNNIENLYRKLVKYKLEKSKKEEELRWLEDEIKNLSYTIGQYFLDKPISQQAEEFYFNDIGKVKFIKTDDVQGSVSNIPNLIKLLNEYPDVYAIKNLYKKDRLNMDENLVKDLIEGGEEIGIDYKSGTRYYKKLIKDLKEQGCEDDKIETLGFYKSTPSVEIKFIK